MSGSKDQNSVHHDLDEDEKAHITDRFEEEIVPKLKHLDARNGNVNCAFAGEAYENWTLRFQSRGADFEIMAFEYDEEGGSMDLDL